jgi:hypothetical protein
VVPGTVQEVSGVEKDPGALDWHWGKAGAREDAGRIEFVRGGGRLKIAQHFSAGIVGRKMSEPAKRATDVTH